MRLGLPALSNKIETEKKTERENSINNIKEQILSTRMNKKK